MAITEFPLTSGGSTANQASYGPGTNGPASITPTANRLQLAAVISVLNAAVNAPTITGNSLTWVQVANVTFNTIATGLSRLTVFRAMGASPSAEGPTIDFGGQTQGSVNWSFAEFAGIDTSGTDGSGAIVQVVTNRVDAQSTIFTVTLAAFGSADNATYGAFGGDQGGGSFTPGTGFSEIHDVSQATPTSILQTEWRADNDTSVDATPNATADMGGIAIEIKAAAAAGGTILRQMMAHHGD